MTSNAAACIILMGLMAQCVTASTAYYVNPAGDDGGDGRSVQTAWKTCAKVNAAKFEPGDAIFFACGGEWREQLRASSSGAADKPIVYGSYGHGPAPRFYGSDLLANANFKSQGGNKYACPAAQKVDAVLRNHVFIESSWSGGILTIISPDGNPATDGKVYSACTRGNVIFSNGKDHLVFENLVADETAGQLEDGAVQGYGFRIESSTDVEVTNCEANRCGRHNFGVINTTGFVGTHLRAAHAQPNTPGGNSFYVSYADAGAKAAKCVHEWDDIAAEHLEDGKGGNYGFFVSHGDKQGLITMQHAEATAKISFMSSPVVVKNCTLKGNASIENFGVGISIDGVRLLDSAAIDQWASEGTIQNCIADLNPSGGGPTGYGSAIVLRAKAGGNVVRFNTLLTGKFSCLTLLGNNSGTKWYGNIMQAESKVIGSPLNIGDIAYVDFNCYGPKPTLGGMPFVEWKAKGFDTHSLTGDPLFGAKHEYELQRTSPCAGTAKVAPEMVPHGDFYGVERPAGQANMGAVQKKE